MFVARYVQNPLETISYDIPFADFLTQTADTIGTAYVSASPGLTVVSWAVVGTSIRVFVTGGTSGQSYEVAASVVTAGGRVKLSEISLWFWGRNLAALTNWPGSGATLVASTGQVFLDGGSLYLDGAQITFSVPAAGTSAAIPTGQMFADAGTLYLDSAQMVLA